MKSKISYDNLIGKVVIFEGLPGAGKSTLLHDRCKSLSPSYPCECYREETLQPLDLFRQAVLSRGDLNHELVVFSRQHPECRSSLEEWLFRNSYKLDNLHIVAYTQTSNESNVIRKFAASLRRYDIGDGRSSLSDYAYYHKLVWTHFFENIYDPQTIYLSEGSLFHNQLFDLVGFYQLSNDNLCRYYEELLSEVNRHDIIIEFVGVDGIASLIEKTNYDRPGWCNQLNNWLHHSPWAQDRCMHGESGIVALYNKIQSTHILLQRALDLTVQTTWRKF